MSTRLTKSAPQLSAVWIESSGCQHGRPHVGGGVQAPAAVPMRPRRCDRIDLAVSTPSPASLASSPRWAHYGPACRSLRCQCTMRMLFPPPMHLRWSLRGRVSTAKPPVCSGSRHRHFGSSSSRSDLLICSVRRRNCPGNPPTAQPSPNGSRRSRRSPRGNRSPKHIRFYQTAMGTASPLSINPSQTRAPAAKVATPNAPNR